MVERERERNRLQALKRRRVELGEEEWGRRREEESSKQAVFFRHLLPHPASRSADKFMEMWHSVPLPFPQRNTLHLCEAPGGFGQATAVLLRECKDLRTAKQISDPVGKEEQRHTKRRKIHASPPIQTVLLTSLSSEGAPKFSNVVRSLVEEQTMSRKEEGEVRVRILGDTCGKEEGGEETVDHEWNLLTEEGREEVVRHSLSLYGGIDLVTADGAAGVDHDNIEASTFPLVKAQSEVALRCLSEGGTFVLKVFESLEEETLHHLSRLCSRFTDTCVVKPTTSRPTNSERYLVFLGFKGEEEEEDEDTSSLYVPSLTSTMTHFASIQSDSLSYSLNERRRRRARS